MFNKSLDLLSEIIFSVPESLSNSRDIWRRSHRSKRYNRNNGVGDAIPKEYSYNDVKLFENFGEIF